MDRTFDKTALTGNTVLLTGAGGGIGRETALAFAALGAFVLLTDIDRARGEQATAAVNLRFPQAAHFLHADLSDKEAVAALCEKVLAQYGCPDILFHNAAVVVTGQVGAVPFQAWEHSYAVNLRAPILLTSSFLPHMRKRDRGCVVFVSSSGAAPYLNAYEVFKTAQGEFSSGLAAELEGTHIYTYTIAPGLVRTQTAEDSIQAVAAHMGLSPEAFYREQAAHTLSPQEAGQGFALSTLRASTYHGQEISSLQALHECLELGRDRTTPPETETPALPPALLMRIFDTFQAQYHGWLQRNLFERQWVLRDFKKRVGLPAEAVDNTLQTARNTLERGERPTLSPALFAKLQAYWQHQYTLLQSFEKDPDQREAYGRQIQAWIADLQQLRDLLLPYQDKRSPADPQSGQIVSPKIAQFWAKGRNRFQ